MFYHLSNIALLILASVSVRCQYYNQPYSSNNYDGGYPMPLYQQYQGQMVMYPTIHQAPIMSTGQYQVPGGGGVIPCGHNTQQQYPPNYPTTLGQLLLSTKSTNNNDVPPVQYIDVSPQQFLEYMKRFKENPTVIPAASGGGLYNQNQYRKPIYTVKTSSSHNNDENNLPKLYSKHEVQNKVYSFQKTFVVKPEDRNKVIELNINNGIPETTTTTPTEELTTTTTTMATTTQEESEDPDDVTEFIDIKSIFG